MTDTTRLLIVDDDADLAADLAEFLTDQGFVVHIAQDVPSARQALKRHEPEICLVDIVMPGPSGRVFCGEVAAHCDAAVIMMSALSDNETMIALLEIGADDYIVKPFHFSEMHARVRAVLRRHRKSVAPPPVLRLGPWALELSDRRLRHVDGFTVALTPSEAEILRFMASSPGTVFKRADLLAVSRTRHHGGTDDRAVDNLIKRLRRKIETDPANARYVVTVWGKGYRLEI